MAIHVDARKLHEADEVRRTLVEADLHADAYFAAIEKDDHKERLRLFTDDAIARGSSACPPSSSASACASANTACGS